MTFSEALTAMKLGYRVTRTAWGAENNKIQMGIRKDSELETEPYLYMHKELKHCIKCFPTNPSSESILANDWEVVEDREEQ